MYTGSDFKEIAHMIVRFGKYKICGRMAGW